MHVFHITGDRDSIFMPTHAWSEVFKGRILTVINAKDVDFIVTKELNKLSSPKKETDSLKDTLFPLDAERVDIHNGSIVFF